MDTLPLDLLEMIAGMCPRSLMFSTRVNLIVFADDRFDSRDICTARPPEDVSCSREDEQDILFHLQPSNLSISCVGERETRHEMGTILFFESEPVEYLCRNQEPRKGPRTEKGQSLKVFLKRVAAESRKIKLPCFALSDHFLQGHYDSSRL
jgi:hypothetical protein